MNGNGRGTVGCSIRINALLLDVQRHGNGDQQARRLSSRLRGVLVAPPNRPTNTGSSTRSWGQVRIANVPLPLQLKLIGE